MTTDLLQEASQRFAKYAPIGERLVKNEILMGPWVRRFLLEHLVSERNLSGNTQTTYRDTLLLPSATEYSGRAIDRMTVEDGY